MKRTLCSPLQKHCQLALSRQPGTYIPLSAARGLQVSPNEETDMNKYAALLFSVLLIACQPVFAVTIEGAEIPDTLTLADGGQALLLNGAGIRKKLFMDIYIGALYLPAKTADSSAILGDSGPASVLMHFLYSEVSKEKIIDGWKDGLKANLDPAVMQSLAPDLERFNALFRTVQKGEVIRIDYLPGSGTEVRINDELRGSVAGNEFYRALLKVWLGSSPVSKSLKNAMLGID